MSGSVEAVEGALQGIGNHLAGVKNVASGVGDVSESDILRAKAVDGTCSIIRQWPSTHTGSLVIGIVVAFIENIAAGQGVSTLKSSIIYQLMDLVKERVIALLPKIVEKKVTGEANHSFLVLVALALAFAPLPSPSRCRTHPHPHPLLTYPRYLRPPCIYNRMFIRTV